MSVTVTDRLAALAPEQRALFERLLEKELEDARIHQPAPPILPVPRDRDLPLSFSQQRLWLIDQIEPGSPAYNIPQVLRLVGEIEPSLLQWIFSEIVRRHESLRTTFVSRQDGPVQVIASPEPLALSLLDLSHLPEKERESQARDLALAEARRPFDLQRGPLLRLLLVRLIERHHLLLLTMHHIVADGWSMGILVREIMALYTAFAEGRPSTLPELPVQYADFAVWQASWLQGEVLASEISFWKRQLAGLPPLLELPTDRPRPAAQTFRGATQPFHLESGSADAVRELCWREEATPFMVLLASWAALLGRHAGQDDVVMGAPVAGRNRREIEGLIGFFVNTLVLRSDLSGDPSFRELLHRVRQASLDAFAHQDLPFERIVEEIGVERNLAISPLFQVLFIFQNVPVGNLTVPGLALSQVDVDAGLAKFDLSLSLTDTGAGFSGALEFATDLFDSTTMDRLQDHFRTLLASAMSDPQRRLAELPLLANGELHQILWEWNDAPGRDGSSCVHHLIETQARRRSELAAVLTSEGVEISYGELDRLADRLASRLRALGVLPDDRVGVCLHRGWEGAVVLLAILKAGGCYLPLDPAYPRERLGFMLSDAAAPVIVTRDGLVEAQPVQGVRLLSLDDFWEGDRPREERRGDLPVVDLNHLSYIIYTSGSTGQPKGVALPHRTLANLIAWQITASAVPAGRTLQFASPSFDVSLQETLATWAAGGTLVLLSEDDRRDAEAVLRRLRGARVERLFLPFVALQQIAEAAARADALPPLREVVTAGEQLQMTPEVRAFFSRLPGCVLRNQYGPSETHVVTESSLWNEPHGEVEEWPALPSIGRPIAGTEVHLLDFRGELVPIGAPGEIYLGGRGLARGYLGRPDLTAARFLPDPWGSQGDRLYRTGDLARRSRSGEIEFLGRIDHQVKIRGFRVEPGEIEAALAEHPSVRQAVIAVREDLPGGRGLVAFVVPDGEPVPAVAELRQLLRERLPEFMVPGHLAFLDRLPVTPSGKVDRRALSKLRVFPEMPNHADRAESTPAASRSPVEELLAGIFAELLQAERVAPGESFFDLGGHSLLATQLVSRLRLVFGVELPVRAVFEAPTVASLATAVERALRKGEAARLPPLVRIAREGPLPLSFAQQRLWLVDQLQPGSAAYNIPVALRLAGRLDPRALAAALSEVVWRHEALRTVFELGPGGEPVQRIQPSAPVPLPVIDLRGLSSPGAESMRLARQEASRPFDLTAGPVLRAALVLSGELEQVLLLTVHHLVSDGWSTGVLIQELATLYPVLARGEASPLPELSVQYADFAVWQRRWLTGEVMAAELAYWRERLAGAPQALELPMDRPRPAVQTFRGRTLFLSLPTPLESLHELARRRRATLFMVLLASVQTLLARLASQSDISVGTPVSGRNHAQTEGLIGFFVNTLVMRSDLADEPAFGALLERVRETALEAYAHQDLPFEKLVEEVAPERDLGRTPLFQVMLVLQNAAFDGLELPDLRLEPLPVDSGTAKFDLTLSLGEDRGALAGFAEHNRDLFDATTVRRLLSQLDNLLQSALAAPERNVFDLELMGAAERLQVVQEWSGEDLGYPRERCVHELFAERAALHPEALAVSFRDEAWSYGELDRRSALLAERLRSLGIGPEVPVGLLTERSLEMVAGVLGILKAGGAYVPLDSSFPAERLEWMLRDTGAPVVLVQERRLGDLPAGPWRAVSLEGLCQGSEMAAAPGRSPGASRDNLAYVLYTSGSTGTPKGVAVPHRAVVRLVRGRDGLCIGADEVWLQLAPLAFDASTLEIWGALANGGRLEVFGPDKPTIEELGRKVESTGVTSLWLTAGLFHQVAESDLRTWRGLRRLLAGGDVLSPAHVRRALEELPGCRVINGYGPTENTTFTCCHDLTAPSQVEGPVPIGRPIANTRVHLVDRRGHPVPPGAPGELLTGGDGLARGYHGRPDLTAELFVPDPFAGQPGERLYRTGDLARWRPGGEIEFLGRIDQQVKIRGFRVEPGEIEAALATLPGAREVVVVAREDVSGNQRLVAYVVGEVETDSLRRSLRERLPDYMVPAVFVTLDALPLTANGKVDRRALPAPDGPDAGAGHLAPRTPVEEILAGIWAEVLGVGRVGVNDHFFDLGGHSLLATRVMSRMRGAFGVEIPLRSLFEAPTLAGSAARIEAALQARTAALAPPLTPIPRTGPLSLSFAQQRLWFIDQLAPGSPLYNIPVVLRAEGSLDCRVLALTLGEIVRRHEALRTVFAAPQGSPVQVIQPAAPFLLNVVDLSGLPESARQPLAHTLAREAAVHPFDLARGPLLRVLLLRVAEGDHVVVLTLHHIVSDGWSMGILVGELRDLYEAFAQGRPSTLPELPIQYADFAVWQRRWFQGEALEAQLDYWKRQLQGAPTALDLPLDHPRPALQSHRGAKRLVALPCLLSEAIGRLCSQREVTPFMTLLAAWAVLLGRHARQDDVLVGAPIAGRNRREIEGLIGFFVNTLVLRSDLSGTPSLHELLERVRRTALDAFTHQDLPFERIVEEVGAERNQAISPLFQAVFALQNAPLEDLEIPGLVLSPFDVDMGIVKFDLTLTLRESPAGFVGLLEYNADLFDVSTVDRLLARFEALLAAAVQEPSLPVAELPILLLGERQQMLVEWNDTRVPLFPACLHELIEAQADRSPDSVAVVAGDESLTYRELDLRANRVGHHLRTLGAGPDVLVGLCAERSPEMVIGMLGILKAGGAYVPIDPDYPQERLAFLLADSGVRAVLTQRHLADRIPAGEVCLVLLDSEERTVGAGGERPRGGALPESLAYVIYTSGSTGRPKGVLVPHAGAVNRLLWAQDAYPVTVADRVLHKASFSFDFSVWECFGPLIAGARLVLARPGEQRDPSQLVRTIRQQEITLVHFIPSMLQVFVAEEGVEACTSLRYVFSGGEALPAELAERCRERVPAVLRNQYGPTEISIDTTDWICRPEDSRRGFVPLGLPLANTALYILDQTLSPMPPGVAGELCVGGAGVTRGYWQRPDLTAEKFVPDPFSGQRGARLYRTGDRALRLLDGNVKFLGRMDHQVKIRGFRIELGEIEATLASHPAVRECVLLVREDTPGSRLLVAYVVLERQAEIQDPGSDLRRFVGERLPEHMVPSAIVALDAFPLSPNGKLDRRALPAPQSTRTSRSRRRRAARPVEQSYTAPSNPVEELLAGIWGEVLGIERVGIHESFFALGGHSLLATQVVSRIRSVLGAELPLRQLFESPTIASLARIVQSSGSTVQAPPILPVPRDHDLPLSFAQQRLWLVDQIEPGNLAYNMPLALRLTGGIAPGLLKGIFSEIVRRHEALRTTFASRDGWPVQVIAPPGPVELPVLDLSQLPESEREARARDLALVEAQRPFDLRRGPLLRLLLVRLAGTDHLLLLTLHHIVSDGWSAGVMLREIAALHEAFSQGRPSPLAGLPVQYADFAVWQRSWLQGEVLDAQLAGWKRQLAGAPAVLELPLDRPRPAIQSYRGARRPVLLSSPLSEAVGRLCRQQGVTPFMALLAAWAVLLGRHAGEDDVLVGAPIAGRNRREIEDLIGFFINTLVLRLDLSGAPSLAELLGRVRRTALDAFAGQDLPFERLVEDLAPERSLAYAPLFQVMFVLQNMPLGELAVPGLAISPLNVDAGLAKFDLSLNLFEGPEGVVGTLTYAVDLFDESTVERLIAGFQTLLAGMAAMAAADPAAPLHDLEVLPEAERRQLLAVWSAEETGASDLSLYELFERQAERTPDAVAVIYEEEIWTYRDLLRRSREIAGLLREQGVGPEARVAILDRRSPERLARVLGVLACGAAFVAIDREQPRARRAEILADVAPVWVFPPQPPLPEEGEGEVEAGVTVLPEVGALGSHVPCSCPGPAYVVYTSGSTGRPKGIFGHHRGAATYLEWIVRNYGLAESDVALQLAPLTFDASLRDTLAPLAAGGRIVIVPDDVARDPAALLERMAAHGVTCLPSIVPSLLRLLVEEALASGRKIPSLRLLLASGEKLHGADAAAVRRAFGPRVSLVNQYGPSETTMTFTWYAATADDEARPALPVGRPAASSRVYLLDRMLRPVPLGAAGEICCGGPGLTYGYLGQPDRTAEAFIPDPFSAVGERLYRTGDRGRYRPDGVLELLGRIDFQVKIRGQRVEPGEVEAVLRSHPAVRQAVVEARGKEEPRLAAWLVAQGVSANDLRAFLAERLPASMIPADWVFLDALPLTPHNKVDRSRLPEPSRERAAAVQEPRDRTELRLVRLWEEILGIQPVGISDNFFTLGGHSLSAVRLMAGIRRLFGRDLSLSVLFRKPTVEELADTLRQDGRDLPWSPLVALTPEPAGEMPWLFIHGGDGHALTFADLARTLSAAGEDRPVVALEARGLADGQTPLESIEDLAEVYLSAIRKAWPRGPYRLLGYSMGGKVAFEMARRLEQEGETVEPLILLDIPALPRPESVPDLEVPAEVRALPGFDPELADRYLAVWRAHLKASHSWTPAPFGGKVRLLVAEAGTYAGNPDPALGWGAVAGGGVEVASTPGDHFSLLRPPHVQTLVERYLKRYL